MRRSCVLVLIAAFVFPAAPVWAQAEVLQVIPDDAIGFALINRVGQTNDKVTALAKRMKIDLPGSPLEMIKGALGVQKGLAEKGSAAIAAFAGKGEDDEPRGLVYVPVTDYKTFLDQLKSRDVKDGISEITIVDDKTMLAGKRGKFAVLADAKDRELLERGLKADKNLATWAEPLTGWLTENDVAGVLTGRGIKLVALHARKGIKEAKDNLGALPPEIQAQVPAKFFDAIESFIKSVETDVTHAGLAARVDQAGNLHVNARAQFLKGSAFAKAGSSIKAPLGGPLAGLPSGPFVLALGGALPENATQALASISVEAIKAGGENIPAETLKKLEEAYAQTFKGMSGMGFVWQVGKEKEPLFANMVATMRTENAAAYLASYEKNLTVMNEIFKGLNLPTLPAYEIKKPKVNGKQALEMSMDFTAGLGLPEEFQKIFKSMFGPDGKMTFSMAARDDKTVVMRYTGADGLKALLEGKDKGLGNDAGVVQVTKALPTGSQWALYLSPKGMTDFADRMVKDFSPIPLQVPRFPATPPVAVGVRISGQGFEMHTVVPAGVVDGVGGFVEQLKRLFRGDV